MPNASAVVLVAVILACSAARGADPAAGAYDMKAARERIRGVEPRMSYLENSEIKVGVNLAIGGAITYLSERGGPNLINSHDWGRQIQMSFYSGPNPYAPDGRQPHPRWRQLGWNPIQSGDVGGHPSRVIEHRNDGRTLFVKCIPMQWPHAGVPGECTYEWTLTLDGRAVTVSARLVNARSDPTPYPARSQELPAIYTNGPWYRLYSYTGREPFTQGEVTLIPKRTVAADEFPWNRFDATEQWAALLDTSDRGLGVWAPGVITFLGGFAGKEGSGGPSDAPTGYIAPVRSEVLDHDIVYDYTFTLIAGSLAEIREWVYAHAPHRMPFAFDFSRDRQHWIAPAGWRDAGWPIKGAWRLTREKGAGRTRLVSPVGFWRTSDLPRVYLRAAERTAATEGELRYELAGGGGAVPRSGSVRFPIRGDGERRTYEITLAGAPGYDGVVRQIFLEPAVNARPGDTVEVEYLGALP